MVEQQQIPLQELSPKGIIEMSKLKAFTFSNFIICLLLLANISLANEKKENLCEDQGHDFGNGKGSDSIDESCFNYFKSIASSTAKKKNLSGDTLAFGFKNVLFLERINGDIDVIAGNSTNLKSIQAIAFDEANKEIAVLEKSGDILFFSTIITGNVAPYRILRSKNLYGSNDLAIDPNKEMVIVSNNSSNMILFYSRMANINGRKGKRNLEMIDSIEQIKGNIVGLAISTKHNELFSLDNNNQVAVYSLNQISTNKPIRNIIINNKTKSSESIWYDQENDHIKLDDSSEEILTFKRSASGSISPTSSH